MEPKKRMGRPPKKAQGLGDTIEQITEVTGIKKAVKWIFGEGCGCEERQQWLNKRFPYVEQLTEAEFDYLKDFYSKNPNKVTSVEQRELITIYNRVYHDKAQPTSCGPCFLNGVYQKLGKLYEAYKVE